VNFIVSSEKLDKYRLWEEGLVQVAYKNATAVAFHSVYWHKIQNFFKRVEWLQRLHYQLRKPTSCSRVEQDPRLHARKFCRPTSGVNVATWLRLNVCWCTSEACKYKKSNHNYGHDDSLLNCNIGWKKHTADLALTNIASRSSQTLSQESFTRKWWLSFKPETQKFTKKAFSFQGKQTFYLPA